VHARQVERRPVRHAELRVEQLVEVELVAEPSERRRAPPEALVERGDVDVARMRGSSFTFVIPNELPAAPSQTFVNVAPPLVDSYSPAWLRSGSRLIWPPLPITCERPRTDRAEPTKM
jgi:hypothetical protein